MTRQTRLRYRSLCKSRTRLKRKLKEARAKHMPCDRILAQLQATTTLMMRMEIGE